MALAQTCWGNPHGGSRHLPARGAYEAEIATNLWESDCTYCKRKIYKRTDDAGMFDPWTGSVIIIVEWP